MLYDKFGEFDSADEINASAEGLFNEGDYENIKVLAKENGIEKDFVDMYLSGDIPVLCDTTSAALGKLEVEASELKPVEIMEDWLDYIRVCCTEDDQMAQAVRRKGKSLKGCIGALLSWSFKARYKVDAEIVKEAKIGSARVEMGIPGMGTAKHLIKEYYLGK